MTQKCARIYINEGVAMLASMNFPRSDQRIQPFLRIHSHTTKSQTFQALEPPTRVGRTGGVGSKRRAKTHKRPKKALFADLV